MLTERIMWYVKKIDVEFFANILVAMSSSQDSGGIKLVCHLYWTQNQKNEPIFTKFVM